LPIEVQLLTTLFIPEQYQYLKQMNQFIKNGVGMHSGYNALKIKVN
jgi:hypothetical protein